MKKKLFVAIALTMGGSLFAGGAAMAGICSSVGLPAGCIDNVDLADKAVSGRTIKGRTINHYKLFLDNIPAANLAPNSVGASELAANSVYGGDIVNGQVTSADIADNSITAADIAANAVGASELAPNSVYSADIVDGQVTAADIATNAVGAAEIGTDAVGNDELVEDLVLGDSGNSGSILVRHNVNDDILRAHADTATRGTVYIGQNHTYGAYDVDLRVWDPTENDYVAVIDASLALLTLGSGSAADPGDDGDIWIENGQGANSITLDGSSGTVQNNLIGGNGLVKAWAKIRADGTVLSCWRCNTSATETRKLSTGSYEVDFTSVSSDIRSRPRMAICDTHSTLTNFGQIHATERVGDFSSVWVGTLDLNNNYADRAFTVMIY